MNKTQKSFFAFSLLTMVGIALADCTVTTLYSPRSQGTNAARQMVGWEELINQCDKDCFYGAFAIVGEYSQTFKSKNICECLFAPTALAAEPTTTSCATDCESECSDCSIIISGSCVENRGANDWLADYFGLPADFQSTITFKPRVQTFVADLEFYVGLSEWAENLYFRLNLPIVHTRWNLHHCENVTAAGTERNNTGYYSAQQIPRAQLLENATAFFTGSKPDFVTGQDPAIIFQPLNASKWSCDTLTTTRLANVEMVLGYNFACSDCGFFGLNLRASAPTGNRPEGEFLFEPIAGSGHHWELGAGLNAHYTFWRSQCNNSTFGFYLDANITHLFKACQTRSFDLCEQGDNSRYMLAQKLAETTTLFGNPTEGAVVAANQSDFAFGNEFAPVANLTKRNVDVTVSVQGDIAFKLAYVSDCGFAFDLGYNFWGRACEKIKPTKCNPIANLSVWALKGDAFVYGFNDTDAVALGATQSDATIHAGAGGEDMCSNSLNAGIDNSQFAVTTAGGTAVVTDAGLVNQTSTSIQPVTLDTLVVNYAANRGLSNKIFANFSYTWKECEDWLPFLGFGVSAEFGQKCSRGCDSDNDCGTTSCPATTCATSCPDDVVGTCVSCAFNEWAVWIKGGIAFN